MLDRRRMLRALTIGVLAMPVVALAWLIPNSRLPAPLPAPATNPALTALLPAGPHQVDITYELRTQDDVLTETARISGPIDLGGPHGQQCQYDLTGTITATSADKTVTLTYAWQRPPQGPAYARITDNTSDGLATPKQTPWGSGLNQPWTGMLIPTMTDLAVSPIEPGAGDGWCALALLDDAATLANHDTGEIGFRTQATRVLAAKAREQLVRDAIDATNADLLTRATTGQALILDARAGATLDQLEPIYQGRFTITKTGTTTTLRSELDGVTTTMTFTPTEPFTVTTPAGATAWTTQARQDGQALADLFAPTP